MIDYIQNLFKYKKANPKKLEAFGFKKDGEKYVYTVPIVDGQMVLTVSVASDKILTEVYDIENELPYTLHLLEGATGSFVGQVRQACENLLQKISDDCFDREVFSCAQSKAVIDYIATKYSNYLEFLWDKFPNYAVWRRHDNQKWYAVLMKIQKNKLGLDSADEVEVLNLRADPDEVEALLDGKSYFKAYHMNKKHWLTINLDGSVKTERLLNLIDKSFNLAGKK